MSPRMTEEEDEQAFVDLLLSDLVERPDPELLARAVGLQSAAHLLQEFEVSSVDRLFKDSEGCYDKHKAMSLMRFLRRTIEEVRRR